jgi:hypothetical protein
MQPVGLDDSISAAAATCGSSAEMACRRCGSARKKDFSLSRTASSIGRFLKDK